MKWGEKKIRATYLSVYELKCLRVAAMLAFAAALEMAGIVVDVLIEDGIVFVFSVAPRLTM